MVCKYSRPAAVHRHPDMTLAIATGRFLRQFRPATTKRLFIDAKTEFDEDSA